MKRIIKPSGTGPYKDDWSYLEDELRWVAARCRRLAAEGVIGGWPTDEHRVESIGDATNAMTLRKREAELRENLDARLAATRAVKGGLELGLDQVCRKATEAGSPLSDEERSLLLVALLPALSRHVADAVLVPLNISCYGRIAVEDAVVLLAPRSPRDWARCRKFFRLGAPLITNKLVILDCSSGPVSPGTIMDSNVALTLECFGVITGDPDAVLEHMLTEAGRGK
jgi:hypothetical protein